MEKIFSRNSIKKGIAVFCTVIALDSMFINVIYFKLTNTRNTRRTEFNGQKGVF